MVEPIRCDRGENGARGRIAVWCGTETSIPFAGIVSECEGWKTRTVQGGGWAISAPSFPLDPVPWALVYVIVF